MMDYSNIFISLRNVVLSYINEIYGLSEELNIAIEIPKDKNHGHLSTNAAMVLAPKLKKSPREIAQNLSDKLKNHEYLQKVEIAGAGFINFTFKAKFWQKVLHEILVLGEKYGKINVGGGEAINIEFVSANPTGPMHIGHSRGAIFGDVLSRIMEHCGYDVTREYCINDAGGQVDILAKSAYLRYLETFGQEIEIPEGYYPGEYLKICAQNIKDKFGAEFKELDEEKYEKLKRVVIDEMMDLIKKDLSDLKIKHDVFFSQASLVNAGHSDKILEALNYLKTLGLVYEGKLEAPKGIEDPEWENRSQLLFKSTDFGDDQDRSVTKSDGSYTYLAEDIAYAKNKIERGFKKNYLILGADHIGYVKRLQAAYDAMSQGKAKAEVILCQMVNFIEDGKPIKMSKRAGSFTTVADVIREVGPDILRFIMLTRKADMILDFDLDLVKSQTKENPIFYVQYAQVRTNSVLENAKINHPEIYNLYKNNADLSELNSAEEIEIIRDLATYPKLLESIAKTGEIHKLPYYLLDLASKFHAFWNLGKENEKFKLLIEDKAELSAARLALTATIGTVIRNGLSLMGVKSLDKM